MAHCGVKARIIDKRNSKIFCGQADGLQCRSLEIFDSLGFADRVWKESNHMLEVSLMINTVFFCVWGFFGFFFALLRIQTDLCRRSACG